ncbi:urease accessory protein UreD [Solirubrobacter taibaiensis]|nr:urease accessory protein UreD [Solirubrobacter taibaiensis]
MAARVVAGETGFTTLRRGERIAPRVLAPGRITLLRSQAGPLAGDHDRVEIVVESGELTVEPIAANIALPGPEQTLLELDVTVEAGARLILEDAPLVVAAGADVIRTTTIRLAPGAVAIVRDVVILGRAGEGPGRLESVLRCDGILHDALRVDPDTWAEDVYVALAPGHRAIGTYAKLGVPGGNLHGPGHLERVSARSAADVEAACKAWRLRDREGV